MSKDKSTQTCQNEAAMPEGWVACPLGNVVSSVKGKKPPNLAAEQEAGLIPYIDIRAFETGEYRQYAEPNAAKIAAKGDLLIVWDGARSGLVGRMPSKGAVGSTLALLQPLLIEPDYLQRFLQLNFDFINTNTRGTGIPHVDPGVLWSIELPVAPLAEQQRIVAKIEVLLKRVNAVQTRLTKISAILKRFRQSVLAAACSGQLTAKWRAGTPSACSALDEAQALENERFQLWCEAEEARARSRKRTLEGTSWKGGYVTPTSLDDTGLPELPSTWRWATFDTFAASSLYGPRFAESEYVTSGGVPTVRTSDIDFQGRITFRDPPCVRVPEESLDHFGLQHHDLLVTRTGATIGKCALYDNALGPAIASAYLIRFRIPRQMVCPRYLLEVFMSPWGQQQLIGGTTAVAQPNVNSKAIAVIPIPVPPVQEQEEIARRVDTLFALAERIESNVHVATVRAQRLPEAILRRAFRGELVHTEVELAAAEGREYEPASVLLARIQEERAQRKPPKRSRSGDSTRRRTSMKKIDKARVQEAIAAIPQSSFAFDDLRAKIPGDYDALKDVLFSMLDDPESGIVQVFDEEAHAMRFQRKAKP